jgi:hypothetical protein
MGLGPRLSDPTAGGSTAEELFSFTTVVMRSVWLTRNNMVFNNLVWSDVRKILKKILFLILEWKPIIKEEMEEMTAWLCSLEKLAQEPLRIENA